MADQSDRTVARRAATALLVTAGATLAAMLIIGDGAYLWIKAVHVIAIISWMAGLLYLPRLFIYHCDAPKGSQQSETFKVMEQRLLRLIINPAMIVAWVLGLWLMWKGGWLTSPWMHVKLLAVLLLSAVHGFYSKSVRMFREDKNIVTARQWRMWNEAPTVLMIVIVVMVIVKPF